MKKTLLFLALSAVILSMQTSAKAADIGGMNFNPTLMYQETGLMRTHDLNTINQKKMELDKYRDYEAEQNARRNEAAMKETFRQYQNQPSAGMEFLQNKDGSIIIRKGN